MITTENSELLVWDADKQLQTKHGDVVCWLSYHSSEIDGVYSIPQLVEENAEQLRSQFLALIFRFGESNVNGKRLVEHLEIRPSFSYWWMTLLTEKCNFAKSPQIDNVIKLMAFKKWFEGRSYKSISLVSSNVQLAKAMRLLADEINVGFEWRKANKQKTKESLKRRIYNYLPYSLRAFVWLSRHLISRWSLKGVGVGEWKKTKAKITFISYLFNLVPDATKSGRFESRYWTALPHFLEENQVESNWLHIYVEDALLPRARGAGYTVKTFNQSSASSQVHVTLHSFLSIGVVYSVLRDWYLLLRSTRSLRIALQNEGGIYWSLLENDFLNSMTGPTAMSNLLFLNLFERAMSLLPRQDKGVYLQENQGWEFGFIYSWRVSGHADLLIGIPHTPSKFWDLRSYFDPRNYLSSESCALPLPDYGAMIGGISKKMYLEAGYPRDRLVEVEALRYLHLYRRVKRQYDSGISLKGQNTLLIFGDYLKENTTQQMELLQKARQYIDVKVKYIVKPHPACPILVEDYPELDLMVINKPIPELIDHCSMVFTSCSTSSSVDAYCAGKIVITALDPKGLNLSPLKGVKGVLFVSSSKELASAVNNIGEIKRIDGPGKDYFYLDPSLPRWKQLLINSR